jgi:hypothetical protein
MVKVLTPSHVQLLGQARYISPMSATRRGATILVKG